jgi:ATP-dependent helicase HrpB
VGWDEQKGELIARKEKRIGEIVFSSTPIRELDEAERISILTEAVRQSGLSLLDWNEEALELQARVNSLRLWRKEETWPDLSKTHLLTCIEDWLGPYLNTIKRKDDFRKLNLCTILRSALPWELQQKLDKLAPEKQAVPSGSMIRIQYQQDGSPPVLAVRLQELFGMLETPVVNEGRNRMMIHLLSPAYRPVQVTQDLASFWANTYAEVRKELRSRYPKHSWPEDPYTAQAVRGVKRK